MSLILGVLIATTAGGQFTADIFKPKTPFAPIIPVQLAQMGLPPWNASTGDLEAFKTLPSNQRQFLKFHAATWHETGVYDLARAMATTKRFYSENPVGTPGLI